MSRVSHDRIGVELNPRSEHLGFQRGFGASGLCSGVDSCPVWQVAGPATEAAVGPGRLKKGGDGPAGVPGNRGGRHCRAGARAAQRAAPSRAGRSRQPRRPHGGSFLSARSTWMTINCARRQCGQRAGVGAETAGSAGEASQSEAARGASAACGCRDSGTSPGHLGFAPDDCC